MASVAVLEDDDSFFNDLSLPTPRKSHTNSSGDQDAAMFEGNEGQPRAKRIACTICRKRKLRCDGARPKCGSCARLNHECGYDEVRKKSGPKRGYVKALEERLAQVETMLKTQEKGEPMNESSPEETTQEPVAPLSKGDFVLSYKTMDETAYTTIPPARQMMDDWNNAVTWDLIGLGTEEPLPSQEEQNELTRIYFDSVHPSTPMIHRPRYLTALNFAPAMRPPVCLRYMIWTLAAAKTDRYSALAPIFYQRARKYAEMDEMRSSGEHMITIGHCQMWVLCAWYEFKHMYFPRAWQSTGKAISLSLMMGLNRVDGAGLDVKQTLAAPKDWTEREERRRTFWMVFCADRYASIGTGWALRLDERDIMTMLPSSEEAFEKSRPTPACSLEQAFTNATASNVSPISGVTMITCLLGRNLIHLHRPSPNDNEKDLNGLFWQRHRQLEGLLSNIGLHLPDHLRIPAGLPDPNVIFMNMLLQTSIICLHQAAIFKADKNSLASRIIEESRDSCLAGAREIARLMKMIFYLDMSALNPFISFSLYVAARVFVQYLKSRPDDGEVVASLQFLVSAMLAMSRKNPLSQSFIAQLEIELDGTGINVSFGQSSGPNSYRSTMPCNLDAGHAATEGIRQPVPSEVPANTDAVKCAPIFELRESQSNNSSDRNVFQSPNLTLAQEAAAHAAATGYAYTASNSGSGYHQLPDRSKGFGGGSVSIDPMDFSPVDPSLSSGTSNNNTKVGSGGRDGQSMRSSKSGASVSGGSAFTPPSIHDEASPPFLSGTSSGTNAGNVSTTATTRDSRSPAGLSPGITPPEDPSMRFDHQRFQSQHQQFNIVSPFGFSHVSGANQPNIFDTSFVTGATRGGGLGDLPSGWDDMSGIEVSAVVGVHEGSGATGLTPITGTPSAWPEGMDSWGGYGDDSGR